MRYLIDRSGQTCVCWCIKVSTVFSGIACDVVLWQFGWWACLESA